MDITKLYEKFLENPLIIHNSRRVVKGCIYWAIRGERLDGNSFTKQALDNGAILAVIDNPDFQFDERCILVADSLKALQELASHHRRSLGIKVIAIAGSNGKTTTKELMKRVLNEKMNTFATPGNYNNHIGLPLSILQITKEHKAAILELGANHAGENAFLCDIAEPDMGIVTNIGKDHLEGFGGIDGVEKANMELFDYLKKNGGTALVNIDDERIVRNATGMKTITYGMNEGSEISGEITSMFPTLSALVNDHVQDTSYEINSQLFGSVNIHNILAAATIGSLFEIDPWRTKNAIESYMPENNRSQIIKKDSNTYILDAYNANPSSMLPAVNDFATYPAQNKVLILGDMFELGDDAEKEHKNILEAINYKSFISVALAGHHFYAFKNNFDAHFSPDTESLKKWFNEQNFQDAVIYLKGSRGMAIESILNE
jgi:UDP-N-acetylmuramoyl-tripeptide--D-alanyl-D-alanine ligase